MPTARFMMVTGYSNRTMFYAFSKILGDAANSGGILLFLSLIGVLILFRRRHSRWGFIFVAIGVGGLAAIAILPIGTWLLRPLEDRFPRMRELPAHVDGIIVLGGAISLDGSVNRKTVSLNIRAARMTYFVALARHYPQAMLVFTGGNPGFSNSRITEAQVAKQFFGEMGLSPQRIIFEGTSRNTHENAAFSRRLINVDPRQNWLLVTSAADMPRAVGCFRAVGWNVIPFPADYHTGTKGISLFPGLVDGLQAVDWGAHEWLGLLYYRLRDWTPAFFPGPND